MARKKIKTYDSAITVHCNQWNVASTENVRVQITHQYGKVILGQFWVPRGTAFDKYGFLKHDILVARAKHDLNIEFKHYGYASYYI